MWKKRESPTKAPIYCLVCCWSVQWIRHACLHACSSMWCSIRYFVIFHLLLSLIGLEITRLRTRDRRDRPSKWLCNSKTFNITQDIECFTFNEYSFVLSLSALSWFISLLLLVMSMVMVSGLISFSVPFCIHIVHELQYEVFAFVLLETGEESARTHTEPKCKASGSKWEREQTVSFRFASLLWLFHFTYYDDCILYI